jgi:hypothetical protein
MEEKAGRRMPIRLGTALVAALGMLLGPLALAASATATPHATTPVMGTYVPVTPFRITDTRPNSGQPNAGKTLTAAATLNVQVTGLGTVPAGASAAVLNVTAVGPTASGFLTVFPEGTTMPTVSNLNFTPGVVVANLVTVPLSSTGMVSIFNHAGSTNVVVDVDGYYTSTPLTNGSGLYNPMSPVRALGTLAVGATVAANTSVPVTVTGALTGVPATATAVVVDVTAAHATAPSYLTVYPAGVTPVPTASNVNFVAGQAVANRVTVGIGSSGQVEVYNHTGTVNVDVDVDGYYSGSGGTGSVFVPITPVRVADTRTASLVGTGTPISANASESFSLATAASGIPATASAVAGNFTVVAGGASGYISVYPTSVTTHPVASDVNWIAKEIVPNFTIADTNGTGSVEVYNSYGTINLVVDVFGYFTSFSTIMASAVVTDTSIAITYNQAVTCDAAGTVYKDFTYYSTGSTSGGGIASASCAGDVLTLLPTGIFTLPTGGTIEYTVPSAGNSVTASVYATGPVYATTQALALSTAVAPTMVSAQIVTSTSLVITYNEDVTCGSTAFSQFVYYASAGFPGGTIGACATGGPDQLILTLGGTITPPTSTGSIVYTAPTPNGPPVTNSVFATGDAADYAATQTLTDEWTALTMVSAIVTPGAYGIGEIVVTYNETVICPVTGGNIVQGLFKYTNGGTAAYPSACGAAGDNLTLTDFYAGSTGTGAVTLANPVSTDSLVYTPPSAGDSADASVHTTTTTFPTYAPLQTLSFSDLTGVPAMVSAVVTSGVSIAITYNEAVFCPATFTATDFTYVYSTGEPNETNTACTDTSADVLTLTGAFNAPAGSAVLTYVVPGVPSTTNQVYAVTAASTNVYAAGQSLTGSPTPIS